MEVVSWPLGYGPLSGLSIVLTCLHFENLNHQSKYPKVCISQKGDATNLGVGAATVEAVSDGSNVSI